MFDQIEGYKRSKISKIDKDKFATSSEWQDVFSFGRRIESFTQIKVSHWRLLILNLGILLLSALVITRLFSLQVISGSKFLTASLSNQIRVEIERAPRGVIYDRNGVVLATSKPGFRIAFNPTEVSKEEIELSITNLSKLLKMQQSEIRDKIDRHKTSSSITIAQEVDRDLVLNVEAASKDLPGVSVEVSPIRSYTDPTSFAHLLGYTGEITEEELTKPEYSTFKPGDRVGKLGVEKTYETLLHGKDGQEMIAVDANGVKNRFYGSVPTKVGESLTLSIDAGLQKVLYEAMLKKLTEVGSTGGAAVAQDPNTGEVLAFVSVPSYDGNLFAQGIRQGEYDKLINNPLRPLLNRVLSATYPPASTFKIITTTAALAEKVITKDTRLESPSFIDLGGGAVFKDWKDHGVINVVRALAESSDTFMYKIGGGYGGQRGMGPDTLAKWSRLFGFGTKTNIGLDGEAKGLIPDPAWKKKVIGEPWYLGNTYNMSIGQGDVLSTPLQLNNAVVSVANGGRLMEPTLLKGVKGKVIRENFIPQDVNEVVKRGMHEVTLEGGTAWPLRGFPIPSAGKTGTGEATGEKTDPYAWYTAFAPYENPSIVITVVFEDAGEGSNVSAPIVKEAFKYWFRDQLPK